MWMLWILLMVIGAACAVIALYVFITNRKDDETHAPKRTSAKKIFSQKKITNNADPEESDSFIKTKLQSLEESLLLYTARQNKINERLQYVEKSEDIYSSSKETTNHDDEEDWKELYYEAISKSEKIENELDATMQALDIKDKLLRDLEKDMALKAEKESLIQLKLNEANSLQNKIELLQREIEGAAAREADLEKLLLSEITIREKYELLQHKYAHLQSESDELRRRLAETNENLFSLLKKIDKIPELESNLEMAEAERIDLRKRLEKIIAENGKLSSTITELNRDFAS